ncbi:hypothetical protein BS50DRAFT_640399 [Corynespora cassiicola Philippines]|uniref:Zn(2)-C6 fungal-type domain-containing protein n=1 Tax=Corynespora cassiicola Philippines TaxID=1448308 RepID=A0A2T2N3W8_CORCC|nr:hypothetical protein BS50DRAFT_640399 [Corynespora cassiicola Philippines]
MPPKINKSKSDESSKPTPKDKGCFQCSRRRIICDKGAPSCNKCIKKGIECSGPERIRFTAGVARRGKFKDCKIPDVPREGEQQALPTTITFPQVRWYSDKVKKTKKRGGSGQKSKLKNSRAKEFDVVFDDSVPPMRAVAEEVPFQAAWNPIEAPFREDDVEEIPRSNDLTLAFHSTFQSILPWIAPLSSEARMLFSYFSDKVAPAMVVLDSVPNGYRDYILPMAFEDEVLRRAVGVVAAQHLSRERPELKSAAEAGRTAVISRLRKDSLSSSADKVFNQFTWATLVVLLVGETVTGSADYGFLVNMLVCLSKNSKPINANSDVANFLQAQANMFELLGFPLLGEDGGISVIQKKLDRWTEWLSREYSHVDTEDRCVVSMIGQCFISACQIYVRRAKAPDDHLPFLDPSHLVLQIMSCVSQIPPTTNGAHALVWACFIAGAEATDPLQRAFFADYMNAIYARTKFRNIPIAVESLRRIWAESSHKRWTQCLPELANVLVM